MSVLQLRYRKGLGYPTAKILPPLPDSPGASGSLVITFRKPATGRADRVLRNVSAVTRLTDLGADDITFYGVQTDSPLASILIWDVAHALPVGGVIRFRGDGPRRHQLEREYFRAAFEITYQDAVETVFTKVARLDAEKSDLDAWTFGIPVGPEDATLLNACVKRILELDVPKKEILLCGRPGENFLYWDQVRIVGEDITAPPVQISRKKNRLAQEAAHPNLCIIHDRVFLPANFMQAVRAFGNAYPLTAFQSLYFDDKLNLVPRRYSDFGVSNKIEAQSVQGTMRDGSASKYAPVAFPMLDAQEFMYANAHRSSRNTYPTGSLYIVKKDVWLRCPQNESLMWAEFEDVEHAERAWEMGIPSRVNPYAFTQSLISRPLLAQFGTAHIEMRNGNGGIYRSPMEALPLPRKPLIKKTVERALIDMSAFARKWAPDVSIPELSASVMRTFERICVIARLVHGARLPVRRSEVMAMLKDFERLVIGDQMPYSWYEYMQQQVRMKGAEALHSLDAMGFLRELLNQAGQRPRGSIYANTLRDYLPRRSPLVSLGSLVSALLLGLQNHRAFYFPGGWLWRYRMIEASTPYVDYADAPVPVNREGTVMSQTAPCVAQGGVA